MILKGDPSLARKEVSLKMLVKTWQLKDQGFLINFRAMGIPKANRQQVVKESIEEFQSEFKQLKREFEDVFNMPDGLPPIRQIDHRIQLEGTDPINIKPYHTTCSKKMKLKIW